MKIQVRYFAALREALGATETLEVPAGTSIADLRDSLAARSARHRELLARGRVVRCALAQRMCAEDVVLAEGSEVAFFPPVTGG